MPRIQFPNVPNAPGVPQLLRRRPAGPPAIVASVAGLPSLTRAFLSKSQWGVFVHLEPQAATVGADGITTVEVQGNREPAINPDSYLDFEYKQEWSISSAPTQPDGFTNYNRVASPFEIKLRMSKGGSVRDRRLFLKQIEKLGTTQLYDIFTPEKTYLRCNFVRAEVSRHGEKGAYWLNTVDVYFQEIRQVNATYSKTVIAQPTPPSAEQQQNNGTQQAIATRVPPPPSVTR